MVLWLFVGTVETVVVTEELEITVVVKKPMLYKIKEFLKKLKMNGN